MKNLSFFVLWISLVFINGCRTTDEGSDTSAAGQVTPNPNGQAVTDSTGGCSAALNAFGFPNTCNCPNGYNYILRLESVHRITECALWQSSECFIPIPGNV